MAVYNWNEDQMDRDLMIKAHTTHSDIDHNHENNVYSGAGLKRRTYKKKTGGSITENEKTENDTLPEIVGSGKGKAIAKTKRPPSEWQLLVKKVLNERQKGLKDAIEHIKKNNLYKK